MNTLYGSAIPNVSDEREIIDVPQVGEEEPAQANHVPRSLLTGIIQPRMEEMFELVRSRLEASGFDKVAGRRVVLTGGGSQLQGVRELAQLILDKQVRMGRPLRSEEHTSELQSLMRTSYAVFCLKKKKHNNHKSL